MLTCYLKILYNFNDNYSSNFTNRNTLFNNQK